ncbi:glg1p [Saccharomyces arboricola H-6]|uniref:glycogenin glucosyltransferase n=1 Tax=Saccharomyces arboricola (strain H-6 / AS 2.3317 / CBS 10644) TaxID=1160507 RepID=J8LLC2_SACAR|nr:glg1p [Saccharomyces arboricola H-6]
MCRKLAIATLLYSADYLPGVFALGHQVNKLLKGAGRKDRIETCLIVTTSLFNDTLSDLAKDLLNSIYTRIVLVEPLECQDESIKRNSDNLALLERPELSFALIKARLWELTQFEQVLYLDSDTLPLNEDFLRLFDIMSKQTKLQIGAVADIGWPDMFNSGVMMLVPDDDTASILQNYIIENTSIDGSDQGILNQFFNQNCCIDELLRETFPREWVQLSFTYNVTTPNLGYESSPAINYFKPTIKLIHFIGKHKPWSLWSQTSFIKNEYDNQWNDVYEEFQEENKLKDQVPKICIDDSNGDENDQAAPPEEPPQVSEPAPDREAKVIQTQDKSTEDQDNESAPNPVPLDFTKWLTTFINKDYPSNQSSEDGVYLKESDDNTENTNSQPELEGPTDDVQEYIAYHNEINAQIKNEEDDHPKEDNNSIHNSNVEYEQKKSPTDDLQESEQQKSAPDNIQEPEQQKSVPDNIQEPEQQKSVPDNIQERVAPKNDLPEEAEPYALVDDNVEYLEKEKEGYEEFLPDVYEADAINDEEGENINEEERGAGENAVGTSVIEGTQEEASTTEGNDSKPQQEMPNFKFDWEDSDYLSKVERSFPDDIFEYAVE